MSDVSRSLYERIGSFSHHLLLISHICSDGKSVIVLEKVSVVDMYGHLTGIQSIALSLDDELTCTMSKNVTKIWNVSSHSCIHSLSPFPSSRNRKETAGCYGLYVAFLPGNTHFFNAYSSHLKALKRVSIISRVEKNCHYNIME